MFRSSGSRLNDIPPEPDDQDVQSNVEFKIRKRSSIAFAFSEHDSVSDIRFSSALATMPSKRIPETALKYRPSGCFTVISDFLFRFPFAFSDFFANISHFFTTLLTFLKYFSMICFSSTGTAFRQQQLPAWRPLLSGNFLITWSLLLGILGVPLGWFLLNTSNQIVEISVDYTDCVSTGEPTLTCAEMIRRNFSHVCSCRITFELSHSLMKPTFLYYALSNYYQNHRRYSRSRDDYQLAGYVSSEKSLIANCWPYHKRFDNRTGMWMTVAPCGAIANSLFNDTFRLFAATSNTSSEPLRQVTLSRQGISWPTDKQYKFRNPPNQDVFNAYTYPPNWHEYLQFIGQSPNSSGFKYEPLIVWMRVAAMPKFRKLYGRVVHEIGSWFESSLPIGQYTMEIDYSMQFRFNLFGCLDGL